MRTTITRAVLAVALLVLVAACDWEQFRADSAHTGNVLEGTLGVDNVADLTPAWTAEHDLALNGVVTTGGATIVVADAEVRAYEQRTGALRWQVPLPLYAGLDRQWSEPSARGGDVYVGYMNPLLSSGARGGFLVIDAQTGEATESSGGGGVLSTATFAGDDIWYRYGEVAPQAQFAASGIEGRLANGVLWRSLEIMSGGAGYEGSPAVAGGVVFARRSTSGHLDAFDAAGVEGCSPLGSFQHCTPLWSALVTGTAAPAVGDDAVYVPTGAGVAAYAIDRRGPDQQPLWQAPAAGASELAIDRQGSATRVFAGSSDGLVVFDGAGCAPDVECQPLWQSSVGAAVGTPAVANGVVYAGSADGRVHAFPAAGCGAPTCEPLWSASVPGVPTSTIVANGRVLVLTATGDLAVFALG